LLVDLTLIGKNYTILTLIGSDLSGSWDFEGKVATSDQFLKTIAYFLN
jgi:hypothetical protein